LTGANGVVQPATGPDAKLGALASDAASIEKDGGGFMKPGEKRKRGRPKKGETQANGATPGSGINNNTVSPQIDPIAELLPVTQVVTDVYSKCLIMYAEDERAKLDQKTSESMSHASAVCLHQYFPNSFGKHAALILLATIVGTSGFNAYILRRENLAKLKAEKEEREKSGLNIIN
jgi:hypothetical protein